MLHQENQTADKTSKMLVNVVLDRSGSMNSVREGTVNGYNEYINGLRADKDTEYSVTLIQFDASGATQGPELTISYIDKPLAEVPEMTLEHYQPRGATPLNDAIGECIRRADAIKGDRAITCVVITDGEENASKEFSKDAIKALVISKEDEHWTFVFVGADIDAYASGSQYGIHGSGTVSYQKGNEHAVYTNSAQATMRRAHSNRVSGQSVSSSMSFYSVEEKQAIENPAQAATPDPGGRQTAQATFPDSKPTPVDSKKRPRDWAVSGK